MNRLIIVGAGGHGKVIADIAIQNGYTDICFVDDDITGECMGFPIVGACADLDGLSDDHTSFVIGVGNNAIRKRIAEMHDINWMTLVHPSAQIAANVTLGKGTVVMAGAVINTGSTVGAHCIINTCTVVEHDNVLGDYVHLSPRVALGGTVTIGAQTHVGIGAVVINNVGVCSDCVIGAGTVVIGEITESGTYVGVPMRKIR